MEKKENTTTANNTNTNAGTSRIREVYNLLIVDRSGSMSTIASATVAGVNETLGTIRAAAKSTPEIAQRVTMISFCGCSVKTFCENALAADVAPLTPKDYIPCCSTPLYDAVGEALTATRSLISGRNDVAVSVTIITDGYENASRKWSGAQIKVLIELLKADGWLFAYIGANQDMDVIKFNLSIDNVMDFKATDEDTRIMFEKEKRARMKWNESVASAPSPACMKSINLDYFKE